MANYNKTYHGGYEFIEFTTADGFPTSIRSDYVDSSTLSRIDSGTFKASDVDNLYRNNAYNVSNSLNTNVGAKTGANGTRYNAFATLFNDSNSNSRSAFSQSSSSTGNKYVTIDGQRYEVVDPSTSTGSRTSSNSSYSSSTNTATTSPTTSSSTNTATTSSTTSSSTNTATSTTSSATTGSTAGSTTSSSTTYTDVKGLDVAGVTAIKNAIQTFVKGYSSKVSAVGTTTATIQQAVKGSASEKMISNLSNSINSSVMESLNNLNKFANQLDTIKSEYAKADTSNTTISSYINNLNKTQ